MERGVAFYSHLWHQVKVKGPFQTTAIGRVYNSVVGQGAVYMVYSSALMRENPLLGL